MAKQYDVEFKKQIVLAYMQGASYSRLEKEHGVAKSTISGWTKKYSEECQHASKSQPNNPYVKEIHDLNQKIAELEKENLFLKKPRHSSRRKPVRDLPVHRRKQRHVWPEMAFQAFPHVAKRLLQLFKRQKIRISRAKTKDLRRNQKYLLRQP